MDVVVAFFALVWFALIGAMVVAGGFAVYYA